jgi:hypothetical protein
MSAAVDLWLVRLAYLARHRRLPDLRDPRRFTELVQKRKLIDRDPRLPELIDKVAAKTFVRDRLGPAWVTPTVWHGTQLPETPAWPAPFVVKSRHGCNQRVFVRDDDVDWAAVRRTSCRWVRRPYGRWLAEWGYRDVARGILVEPFVGPGPALPTDYKLYVMHGRVAAVQVHLDRETRHRWLLLDRQWRPLGQWEAPKRPATLGMMIDAAEQLGAGFEFARVDLYDIAPHPRFGEITFYPGSGLDPFETDEIDKWLGAIWRERRQDSPAQRRSLMNGSLISGSLI